MTAPGQAAHAAACAHEGVDDADEVTALWQGLDDSELDYWADVSRAAVAEFIDERAAQAAIAAAAPAGTADPLRCPACGSPEPRLHPAVSGGGEVTRVCQDPFHAQVSAAPGSLRSELEATVRIWREESEPYADEDAENVARRGGFGYCADELAQVLARHPEQPQAAPGPDAAMAEREVPGMTFEFADSEAPDRAAAEILRLHRKIHSQAAAMAQLADEMFAEAQVIAPASSEPDGMPDMADQIRAEVLHETAGRIRALLDQP